MLAILGAVVEAVAVVGEIVGLVEFAAKLRRWWDGEAEPDSDELDDDEET